jgi:hypothetical protein
MSIGPMFLGDGNTPTTGRQGTTGEAIVGHAHGAYHEAASRGVLFSAQEVGSGSAPGTSLGTTACLSLYNPPNSGKKLSIIRVSLGYISGTLGAGTLFHCVNTFGAAVTAVAAPTSGTLLVNYMRKIGGQPMLAAGAAVGVARVGSTVTTPTTLEAFCSFGASLASTAVAPWIIRDEVKGSIVIDPGFCYQLQAVAAGGSTPLVSPGVVWEEIPMA